jgi:hypothetical protein
MGSELDQARSIAERIARRLSQDSPISSSEHTEESDIPAELAAMRLSLGDLQRRLGQIETRVRSGSVTQQSVSKPAENQPVTLRTRSPWLQGVNASLVHPSQEKFGVEEATVTQLVDFLQSEKQCSMEPGGKPCDHCAMCSSRGF